MGALPPLRAAPVRIAPGTGQRRRTGSRNPAPLPKRGPDLEADLGACEDARLNEKIEPRAALKVIQLLYHHRQMLAAASKLGDISNSNATIESTRNERPS